MKRGLNAACSAFAPRAFALLLALAPAVTASALEAGLNLALAYYPPTLGGYRTEDFAPPDFTVLKGGLGERDLGGVWGAAEAKATLSVADSVPLFAGAGPLFSANKLSGRFDLELSPVSANALGRLALTPIAFLVFEAGAGVGTGWTAGPFRGLGINPPASSGAEDIDLTPFGGVVWRAWGAGTFQFDLAAVFPGAWNHVVVLATAKVEHEAYTGAGTHDAWLWEADAADNFNGAKLYMTGVLAYRLPLPIDTVGFMAETEERIDAVRSRSPVDSGGWGSDFRIWKIAALANFAFGPRSSLAVLAQFRLESDWTDETTRLRDFRERVYEGPSWSFYRLALSYTYILLPAPASR